MVQRCINALQFQGKIFFHFSVKRIWIFSPGGHRVRTDSRNSSADRWSADGLKIRKTVRKSQKEKWVDPAGLAPLFLYGPRQGDYEATDRIPRAHKKSMDAHLPLSPPPALGRLVSIDSISLFDHFGERIMNLLKKIQVYYVKLMKYHKFCKKLNFLKMFKFKEVFLYFEKKRDSEMCQVFLSLSLIDVRMTGVGWQSGSLHAPGWWERQFLLTCLTWF